MAGYTITYDGVASTTIPEFLCHVIKRTIIPEVRDEFISMAGMEGAWHFPEKRGLKTIIVEASVLASSFPVSRRATLEQVADWAEKTSYKKFISSDQPDRYDMAILSESADIEEWREKGTFELRFRAHPYSYKIAVDSQTSTLTAAGSWNYTLDTLCKVNTYPIIQIQPLGGNLGGFFLTVGGRTMYHTETVLASNYVTVNSLSYTVNTGTNFDTDLQGVFDPTTLSMLGASGQFPILGPGSNVINITPEVADTTATSLSVVTSWRRRYRS